MLCVKYHIRLTETEGLSIMQTSIIGKGLLRSWKCMVVILGIIGEPLVRKKWRVVQAWDGKGKPHGCLEPTKAVTKGKPHVFENQSDNLRLNHLSHL